MNTVLSKKGNKGPEGSVCLMLFLLLFVCFVVLFCFNLKHRFSIPQKYEHLLSEQINQFGHIFNHFGKLRP